MVTYNQAAQLTVFNHIRPPTQTSESNLFAIRKKQKLHMKIRQLVELELA